MPQSHFNTTDSTYYAELVQPILEKEMQMETAIANYFSRFTGKIEKNDLGMDEVPNTVIVEKNNLVQEGGDEIIIPLLRTLKDEGIAGDLQLEGNEEAQAYRFYKTKVNQLRKAVKVMNGASGQRVKNFQLFDKARPQLSQWWGEEHDFNAFYSILEGASRHVLKTIVTGGTAQDIGAGAGAIKSHPYFYCAGTGAVAWSDTAGTYETNIGTALGGVDASDPFDIDLLDDIATEAQRLKLKPIEGDVQAIVLLHPNAWNQLSYAGGVFQNIQRDALNRGNENPIFTGARGMYKGLLIHVHPNVPGVTVTGGVPVYGTTTPHTAPDSNNVKMIYIMGAQALCKGMADDLHFTEAMKDYDNARGIGSASIYGYRRPDWVADEYPVVTGRPINPTSFVLAAYSPNVTFA